MNAEFEGPDLVVAGAGGGLIAALRAAELGRSVLVVEANPRFKRGNNTSMSTAMIPGAGSRWQREAGVADSPENFLADVLKKTGGTVDEELAQALAGVSARLVEWMADHLQMPLSLVTDFPYPGHSQFRCHTVPGRSGSAMLDMLLAKVGDSELIDVLVPARLEHVLLAEDGSVRGVTVSSPDGTEEIPTRAVLLATNGYGANRELVHEHLPEIAGATYYGSEESTGDALRIGRDLGAATAFLDSYQGHAALASPSAMLTTWATVMHGGFLVNEAGQRYGDETMGYSEYARESVEHAAGRSWIILDQRIYDACLVFQDFVDVVESGGIHWADDAASLAESCGIEPLGLVETVRQAQSIASAAGLDPWGRTAWEAPLEGKLGAVFVEPALFHTQGGLAVDGHARVLSESSTPITGLYASGGAATGISGHGPSGYLAGNGLLPALGLSLLAAEHVAAWDRGS
ncbi:fumarate reductase flavoprotein subunit [Citricoccus zhacaiensis]|uniref:Fumarate reductase flavoprotein subunit n=1 Tax=Citricoccus zhacaiensis TaxID=489142 RepID=A0ABQ2M5B5_9MICC|nr:FAD-binding protein [Citricoccus zhacaiensis]GGO47239.1 fumarate reductase flavoprotein subunit [Citricoccus zhacaiensis]